MRKEWRGAARAGNGGIGVTGLKVCGCDEGSMEAMVLTAYLDASGAQVTGNVQILFEAGFPAAPPDEVKKAVDEMTQICSDIVGGRIGPVVQAIARETGVVPGIRAWIFFVEFRYTDDHGRCVWKVKPEVNPKLVLIEDGLIPQIAEECAKRCAPVMTDRFSDCAAVRTWTVG